MGFNFDSFGCMVFGDRAMKASLSQDIYNSIFSSIQHGESLDENIADDVACAMKDWAIMNGATHFTHWFQPMTNITAGKHDSFISPQKDGSVILNFSGKDLIKGEPDASSFPSGGLRNTFEARGYTAWDCTSPAFIRDGTLYIPTAFCSYTGEALDTKTPLLRSMAAISTQGLRFVRLFGNKSANHVYATVGAEQEYFLIDRGMYEKRLDLKICGRTLFGAKPPKGQEMDDHYLGRIRLKIANFMKQLDEELWKLGVSSKTKHNEAAPAQHELAPIFDRVNIACDHNQLTMEMMRIIAKKNGLACLLHEKPFLLVNGSGKHNNWSLSTDNGLNLLEPGKNPEQNIQFLVLLSAIIKAVDKHAGLLRMSTAVPGNDHRLGASEAPPAIISIFLGNQLTSILEQFISGNQLISVDNKIDTGVATLPDFKKDDSDRNRTSPFAFTGNKFEFRMVGSSSTIATANYILNTIVAEALDEICDRLENSEDFDNEVKSIICDTIKNNGRIIYNGNNYSKEWLKIARERGLKNLSNTIDAITEIIDEKSIEVLEKYNVLSRTESFSRYNIMIENYIKIITIEANTVAQMVNREILPSIINFAGQIAESYKSMYNIGVQNDSIKLLVEKLSIYISKISLLTEDLLDMLKYEDSDDSIEDAIYFRDVLCVQMQKIRNVVDMVEVLVDDKVWPMPNYTDLLHRV